MPAGVDLRSLAELTAPERAFLSVYLSRPKAVGELDRRFKAVRRALKAGGEEARDEREHFDENVKLVRDYLDKHPPKSGSLCLLACWVLDFFKAIPLAAPVPDLVMIDASPYLRPLAELEDEYENVAVVVADNKKARIFVVSSAVAGDAEVVKGNVKNHVRKGGWSQQRYERRRDKQLLLYAREIAEALVRLSEEEDFRRIILVGSKETLRVVHEELPQRLRAMVAEKAVNLGGSREHETVNAEIAALFAEQERQSEADLWEKIRVAYLRGGLGIVGIDAVVAAAQQGRVETAVVDRTYKPEGRRCRECEHLEPRVVEACPACGSKSVFAVDLVSDLVDLLERTSATIDFADPIPTLTDAGRVAALLRY